MRAIGAHHRRRDRAARRRAGREPRLRGEVARDRGPLPGSGPARGATPDPMRLIGRLGEACPAHRRARSWRRRSRRSSLTPLVRRVALRLRHRRPPEQRRVNTRRSRAAAASRSPSRSSSSARGRPRRPTPCSTRATRRRDRPDRSSSPSSAAPSWPPSSASSTTRFELRARWQFARPARARRRSPSCSASASTFIDNPVRLRQHRLGRGRSAIAFTVVWIVGMINSINFIDGLDGLSSGIAAHRRGHARAHQPHDAASTSRSSRSCASPSRARCSASCAGTSTRPSIFIGHERRDVRRLHPGRAVDPRHGQGRGRPARPRRPDHRHVLDHRPARSPSGGRRSPRTAATSTTGCSTSGCRHAQTVLLIYGICILLAVLALVLSGTAAGSTRSSASSSRSGSCCSC